MEGLGVRTIAVQGDVAKAADGAELIRRTETELGTIDILVNNAGIERVARFDQALEADITDTLTINLAAPMLLTRAIVPGMLTRCRGHVVNIASGAGKVCVAYGLVLLCEQARPGRLHQRAALGVPGSSGRLLGRVPRLRHRCRHVRPLGEEWHSRSPDRRYLQTGEGR